MTRLEELVEAAKAGFKVGTVRHWAQGDVRKTASGWELQTTGAPKAKKKKTPSVPAMSKAGKAALKKGYTVISTNPTVAPVVPPKPVINISMPPGVLLDPLAPGFLKKGPKAPKVAQATPSSKTKNEFAGKAKDVYAALKALGTTKETSPVEAQATVREGLKTLLADFNIHPAPRFHVPPGSPDKSDRYLIKDGDGYSAKTLRGSRSWSGKIRIAKEVHEKAMDFLKGGPPYDKKPIDAANSFRTLVHEQIHGTNILPPESYKGLGLAWEEALTEMSARKVMVDEFGVDSKDMHDIASYSGFIRSLRKGVQAARLANGLPDLDGPSAFAYIGEAALATRRNRDPVLNLEEYKRRFAENLTTPAGFDDKNPTATDDYRRDVVTAIDNWFKQTLS